MEYGDFYLVFVVNCSPLVNGILILFFAILHFLPIKFAYPSQASQLKGWTIAVSVIFLVAIPLLVFYYPTRPNWLLIIMLSTALYFGVIAAWDTFR